MNSGLIVLHFWTSHTDPLEIAALNNTKKLLERTKIKNIIFSGVEDQSLLSLAESRQIKVYSGNVYENNGPLTAWITGNNIGKVYICGLHFNACVMNLTTKLFEVSQIIGKKWEIDFFVKIVEECTAGTRDKDTGTDIVNLDEITSMTEKNVNDWLVKQAKVE